MGRYAEYLDMNLGMGELTAERKKQLARISELRGGRDVLVYSADLSKQRAPIAIAYDDLLPIADQLENLHRSRIDVILETPGGSGETVEDIVNLLRRKYEHVAFIVPGVAKSAGTILTMAGDEILMEATSSLGPIDAQMSWQGKVFSAHALLEGLNQIKEESDNKKALNRAYIPILQNISPGEIQEALNALHFSRRLVASWLAKHKFRNWTVHSSSGTPVTEDERNARAQEIAAKLCDHSHWLTHGRSVKMSDLREMRLHITDYEENQELFDAIRRYYVLLQMTLHGSNIYKLFETPVSQVYRFVVPAASASHPLLMQKAHSVCLDIQCSKCHKQLKVQADFEPDLPLQEGVIRFPKDNKLVCPECNAVNDLSDLRLMIESQVRRKVVSDKEAPK